MNNLVIAGTDTNIGKTICCALLMSILKGTYFKPVQSGCIQDNDTKTVKILSELSENHFLKERYLLKEPFSPHFAAEQEGISINKQELILPLNIENKPLIIELAGGLMVPLNRQTLFIDVLKDWHEQVILCAKTSLGTINHTLLSIEAMKSRGIKIAGLIFIGEDNKDNIKTILSFSNVKQLGYIPVLENINKEIFSDVFNQYFDKEFFEVNYELSTVR